MNDHHLDMVSVEQAQTWIMIATYEFRRMHFHRSWLSTGRAVRLVQMMGLHCMDQKASGSLPPLLPEPKDWTAGEERRRTFWMAFCLDRYASIGHGWPMTVDDKDVSSQYLLWSRFRNTLTPMSTDHHPSSRPRRSLPELYRDYLHVPSRSHNSRGRCVSDAFCGCCGHDSDLYRKSHQSSTIRPDKQWSGGILAKWYTEKYSHPAILDSWSLESTIFKMGPEFVLLEHDSSQLHNSSPSGSISQDRYWVLAPGRLDRYWTRATGISNWDSGDHASKLSCGSLSGKSFLSASLKWH